MNNGHQLIPGVVTAMATELPQPESRKKRGRPKFIESSALTIWADQVIDKLRALLEARHSNAKLFLNAKDKKELFEVGLESHRSLMLKMQTDQKDQRQIPNFAGHES